MSKVSPIPKVVFDIVSDARYSQVLMDHGLD